MIDPEWQQLTLNICGNTIVTRVRRTDEASLKSVEKAVNNSYHELKLGHPKKNEQELLAMTAFQFAKYYFDKATESSRREKELTTFIKEFEDRLNKILLEV